MYAHTVLISTPTHLILQEKERQKTRVMRFRERGYVSTQRLGVSQRTMDYSRLGGSTCFIPDLRTIPAAGLPLPQNKKYILPPTLLLMCKSHDAK